MRQVVEHLQSLLHDIVRALALDVDHEADAAGVVLVRGIVEALRFGDAAVVDAWLCPFVSRPRF